jgi:hypothetical protein
MTPLPARSRNPAARARERGAALLVLLAVASLAFASVLIGAFSRSGIDGLREQRTLARLADASEALVGYAATHGRLPRPAASALDGREREQSCSDEASCTGFLPWVTLGVDGSDSWGKLLRYSVTPRYTVLPVPRISTVATKRVLTRNGAGEVHYIVGQGECTLAAQCAPAVVFSQGRDAVGTSVAGLRQANPAPGNEDEQLNDEGDIEFFRRARSEAPLAPGGRFDDLLVAIPLQTLYERMAAARTLP